MREFRKMVLWDQCCLISLKDKIWIRLWKTYIIQEHSTRYCQTLQQLPSRLTDVMSNEESINVPFTIWTFCIPWLNIITIYNFMILGRWLQSWCWWHWNCFCRIMECSNRKPCFFTICYGPMHSTLINSICYDLQKCK